MSETIKYKVIDIFFGSRSINCYELNTFWFSKREWREIGHDILVRIGRDIGIEGLHAAEGGFDDGFDEKDDYHDARYDIRHVAIGNLWRNGMKVERFWQVRIIFRLVGIATFDTQEECVKYIMMKKIKANFDAKNIVYDPEI